MFGFTMGHWLMYALGLFTGLMLASPALRKKFFGMSAQIAEGWKRQGADTKAKEQSQQAQPKQANVIQQHPCRHCHAKVYDNEPFCWNCGNKQ